MTDEDCVFRPDRATSNRTSTYAELGAAGRLGAGPPARGAPVPMAAPPLTGVPKITKNALVTRFSADTEGKSA
jgi:hypothetical protein